MLIPILVDLEQFVSSSLADAQISFRRSGSFFALLPGQQLFYKGRCYDPASPLFTPLDFCEASFVLAQFLYSMATGHHICPVSFDLCFSSQLTMYYLLHHYSLQGMTLAQARDFSWRVDSPLLTEIVCAGSSPHLKDRPTLFELVDFAGHLDL